MTGYEYSSKILNGLHILEAVTCYFMNVLVTTFSLHIFDKFLQFTIVIKDQKLFLRGFPRTIALNNSFLIHLRSNITG